MKLIEGVGLAHSYDYPLFSDINISISKGESVAILGSSGSGKSTLLHILSTLLSPVSGSVFYDNKDIYSLDEKELNRIRRLEFGIIFQAHYLFRGFSALENIELASILSNEKIDYELIKRLEISQVLAQKVGSLSGGQQQRVSIARVLSKKPKLIFADEPTGNLDQNTASQVIAILLEYVRKNSAGLVVVTHDEKVASGCDSIYFLQDGALLKTK